MTRARGSDTRLQSAGSSDDTQWAFSVHDDDTLPTCTSTRHAIRVMREIIYPNVIGIYAKYIEIKRILWGARLYLRVHSTACIRLENSMFILFLHNVNVYQLLTFLFICFVSYAVNKNCIDTIRIGPQVGNIAQFSKMINKIVL